MTIPSFIETISLLINDVLINIYNQTLKMRENDIYQLTIVEASDKIYFSYNSDIKPYLVSMLSATHSIIADYGDEIS